MKAFIQATSGFFLCLPLVIAVNVHAQTPVAENARERVTSAEQKLRMACGDEVTKYCSTVTPGEGRILFCMMAHEDKISTKCDYALYSAARNLDRAFDFIEQAADACWADIEKLCADVPEGGGRIAQCIITKNHQPTRIVRGYWIVCRPQSSGSIRGEQVLMHQA